MWEFFRVKDVVGRKPHTCSECRQEIEAGVRHHYCAGKVEGYFETYREHIECRAAWDELNFTFRDGDWGEGAVFLADDDWDAESRAWLWDKHPVVAARLWGPAQ